MNITYKSNKLQKQLTQPGETVKAFGKPCAKKIFQRIAELQAASNLAMIGKLPPPRCHELVGNLKGIFSVDLEHPYRLYFRPNHNPLPTLATGGLDWSAVTDILVIEVYDPH